MHTTQHSAPEPLEARIAPASVITFIDVDNDVVKITASAGTLALGQLFFAGGGTSGQLERLDLTAASFAGADIVFTVAKKAGGDGQVQVGFIDAAGVDLSNVTVKGDLGRIVAGDVTTATNGLGTLSVLSLGARGLTTQAAAGTLASIITGTVSKLSVKGSVVEASFSVTGSIESVVIGRNLVGGNAAASGLIFSQGVLGSAVVSGSILGGTGDNSGRVASGNSIGDVTIGRNLVGGSGADSGAVESAGSLGKVKVGVNIVGGAGASSGAVLAASAGSDITVGGSIIGGAAAKSGAVEASSLGVVKVGGDLLGRGGERSGSIVSTIGLIGPVTIGGNVDGGAGLDSGVVESETTLGNVKIGRGLIGDSGPGSGRLQSGGNMGTVSIGGDVRGGSSDGAGQILSDTGDIGRVAIGGWLVGGNVTAPALSPQTLTDTGVIRAAGRIDGVSLGGSLFAGVAGGGGGALVRSGAIIAGEDLGPVSVGGGLLGNDTNPVRIIAMGQAAPTTSDLAISSITVKGDAVHAEIFAGFGFDLVPGNADASIGTVKIAGDWIAGNIIAGVQIGGAAGYQLQTAADDPGLVARIAEINIGGGLLGTAGVLIDRFDFVSQEITKLRIGKALFPLTPGPGNDLGLLIPGTNDVRVLEV